MHLLDNACLNLDDIEVKLAHVFYRSPATELSMESTKECARDVGNCLDGVELVFDVEAAELLPTVVK